MPTPNKDIQYSGGNDTLYEAAKTACLEKGYVSVSILQRNVSTGYNRSLAMIEAMEAEGFCSAADRVGRRKLLTDK